MAGDSPVTAAFFLAAFNALERGHGPKMVSGPDGGFHPNLDEIRKHLAHAEALFRGLPRDAARTNGERASDLDYFAGIVERLKREANDFGSEAFPPNFWESCEEIEGYLRKAADKLRQGEGADE